MNYREIKETVSGLFFLGTESPTEKIVIVFNHDGKIFVRICKLRQFSYNEDSWEIKTKHLTSTHPISEIVLIKSAKSLTKLSTTKCRCKMKEKLLLAGLVLIILAYAYINTHYSFFGC